MGTLIIAPAAAEGKQAPPRNVMALFPLGDDCRVYPGHGPATTLGEERRSNSFLWYTSA